MCKKLAVLGGEIHGISRSKRQNSPDMITWWQSDLSGAADVFKIVKSTEPEIVYHLSRCVTGSRNPDVILPTFQSNLGSAANLLTTLEKIGCQRVILAGSMEEPQSGHTELSSISPYAISKWIRRNSSPM